jgi:Lar family restriction alleviation protein
MSYKDDINVLSGRLHRIIGMLCGLEDDLGIVYDELDVSEQTCHSDEKKSELKPCPFCGEEAAIIRNDIGLFVGCFNTDCPIGPATSTYVDGYDTEAEAIEAWNTRAQTVFGMTLDDVRQMMKRDAERRKQ